MSRNKYIGLAFILGLVALLALAFYNEKLTQFSPSPYKMMLKSGCDPEKTFYRQTLATQDYFIPFMAYNEVRTIPRQRFQKHAFIGLLYPDLSYIKATLETPEQRGRKIGIFVHDLSKVANPRESFENTKRNLKLENTSENDGLIYYDGTLHGPNSSNQIWYVDPSWKNGFSYGSCSKRSKSCKIYASKGRLLYDISFSKDYLSEIQLIRNEIIKKFEGYKNLPDNSTVLPEEFSNMRGRYKCQHH